MTQPKKKSRTFPAVLSLEMTLDNMTRIAILAALGVVLSLLEFPIFPAAGMYKLDPSGLAVILAGFTMGLPGGVLTLLIKDLVGILVHPSGGWVGQLADFIMLFAYILPPVLMYHFRKTRGTAQIGMIIGTLLMAVVSIFANLYVMFPLYHVTGIGMDFIMSYTVPFNLIKGAALTLITYFIYKPLSPLLHGKIFGR